MKKQANFYPRIIDLRDPFHARNFTNLSTGKSSATQNQDDRLIPESSIIIEYQIGILITVPSCCPKNRNATQVRLFDRIIRQ